ncbi:hypothetical protein SAMN05216227_10381, partial [Pseudorhodobacter antarcticus]
RCSRDHSAAQERQAMETRHSWRDRAERGPPRVETLRPDDMATMERLSPPKPRRNKDALCQTAGSAPYGAGLRPSGRGVPSSCCRPERLHHSRHAHYRSRGISLSGDRGTLTVRPFVQQSPFLPPNRIGSMANIAVSTQIRHDTLRRLNLCRQITGKAASNPDGRDPMRANRP